MPSDFPDESAASAGARTAWGYGLATIAADGTVLDTWFPEPRLGGIPAGRERWIAPAEGTRIVVERSRRA